MASKGEPLLIEINAAQFRVHQAHQYGSRICKMPPPIVHIKNSVRRCRTELAGHCEPSGHWISSLRSVGVVCRLSMDAKCFGLFRGIRESSRFKNFCFEAIDD